MELIPKIEAFRDVEYLKKILSKNGIGGFRPWRNDGYKWISFSDYYSFGNKAGRYGQQNNVAYYISSDIAEFAQEIKLVLNINNMDEQKEAIDRFLRIALKTFTFLNLTPPHNLLSALMAGTEFQHEDESYYAFLRVLKTNVYSWSLVIRTK